VACITSGTLCLHKHGDMGTMGRLRDPQGLGYRREN
jgi:hypothetical protein